MAEQTTDNRRDFLRMQVEAQLRFSIPGQPGEFSGVSRNLSAAGVLFETEQPVEQGQELQLRVLPAHEGIAPLSATLRVIRVEREGGSYLVAGEMLDVS